MEGLDKTIQEIEQRHLKRQQEPWNCNGCGEVQKPPPVERGLCAKCLKTALSDAQERRMAAIDGLMKGYGVPDLFVSFKSQRPKMGWADKYANPNQRGLFLSGKTGTGKTVAMALIMRRWLKLWAAQDSVDAAMPQGAWRFISCTDLIMKVQDTWRSEESAYKLLKSIAETPRLIMDDLAAEKTTDYVRQAVYFIINEREMWGRQTFITSNYDVEQIRELYDGRLASRIAGMCDLINLAGGDEKDLRVEKGKQHGAV